MSGIGRPGGNVARLLEINGAGPAGLMTVRSGAAPAADQRRLRSQATATEQINTTATYQTHERTTQCPKTTHRPSFQIATRLISRSPKLNSISSAATAGQAPSSHRLVLMDWGHVCYRATFRPGGRSLLCLLQRSWTGVTCSIGPHPGQAASTHLCRAMQPVPVCSH